MLAPSRAARAAALLLVVTAVLFAIGTRSERNPHASEATTPATTPVTAHAEGTGGGETGGEGTPEATHTETPAEGSAHTETTTEGKVLGVDIEAPAAVAFAVIVSLALAAGLWWRRSRGLCLAAVAIALVFGVFDVGEVLRQVRESRAGLAVLAGAIALGHGAAAGLAAAAGRSGAETT